MENQSQSNLPTSAMAVTALVLGIIAIVSSWMPIINNFSFLLAILGTIFAIAGLVGTVRGKRKGKGLAVAGLVLGVVSFAVVLVTQSAYSAAIDEVSQSYRTSIASSSSSAGADGLAQGASDAARGAGEDYQNLAVGTVVEDSNGLSVSVDSFQTGVEMKYSDSPLTVIAVTYVNNGSKDASFNPYDWKCQDANGVQGDRAFVMEGENELSSGSLAPGGTVSGNVYFEGEGVLALYYTNMFNDGADASWVLE
ncbi:DUF4190 domain-containing protein [Adlercreutzia aquisgranensis]|uniref:DUF4190 domain-containing protein n=1 Tax=Adlercreutzia aquisgranensis TaxID=2941323 RepID=UPI00203BE9CA|nr:DUF4190 domain-containing protein [Adlercreutzia aquisgranensis]